MIYLISIFTLVVSYISSFKLSNKINIDFKLLNFFFIIKFLYFLLTIYYNSFNLFGTDAKSFYLNSNNFSSETVWIGDNLIYGINYFLKEYFYLDFFSVSQLTFFLVIWSTLLLLSIISNIRKKYLKLFLYILLLLPSLNFWTNGLSKDMLTYCALSFFIFSMYKKNNVFIIFSLVLLLLVRPYVLFFILSSFCIIFSVLFLKNIFLIKKKNFFLNLVLIILFLLFFIIFIFFISKYLLGSFGANFLSGNIFSIVESLQRHYAETPLGVPIDTNFIIRFFNYFFYPYPWSDLYNQVFYLIMIFENLFIILLLTIVIYKNLSEKNSIYNKSIYDLISIISFVLLGLILSQVTSNLGIAFRQKWMILPFLIIMISYQSNKTNKI